MRRYRSAGEEVMDAAGAWRQPQRPRGRYMRSSGVRREDFIANATDEVTEAILSCGWRSGVLSVVARKTCVLVVMTIFGNFSIYFVVSIILAPALSC